MKYTTQMDAAKKGIITKQMKEVAFEENLDVEIIREKLSKGTVVIPANKNHISLIGKGVGDGLKTKINVNLGVSEDTCNIDTEVEKAKYAINLKADAIMDLSTFGNTGEFRKKLVNVSPVMLGTVPVYDAVAQFGKTIKDISVDDFFSIVETHAKDGIDFLTIHAGLNRTSIERVQKNERLTHIVSRGGSVLYQWMLENDKENPFYENYDRLLEICKKHDVTLSLGDGLRPGSLKDATDAPQIQELIILGELTKEAWKENVQVMIEGPGHVPLNEIAANMQIQKKLCHGAPFYVLGPIVTDIAPGYDHITSAIGGAIAATHGADFLCYVTPAEHLRLPTVEDVKDGIIATRIAAHAADIAKGIKGAINWDNRMSKARGDLNWNKMFELAINPEKAIKYRESDKPKDKEVCTMCGELCAIKRSKKA
ncbi:phosphomethylpyrimidine synthase ThiC [Haliovirga abyssi]|uniref:Phosphomethylpyrimidine synthase n=1 Tax=Haliovirga abyssi TaxID=2996794 RepID=A0AAU9DGE4_9FUSO|nr:phosphomethylpyrimidine synthase ThiC [Haliovirga abyssi]BDU51557.1 phosphomethylpyrimidine synthase [Haliovirga abyssi]